MSARKLLNIDNKCRVFHKDWEEKYFFKDVGSIAVCLIYCDTDSIFKAVNLKSHFTLKHEGNCADLFSDARNGKPKTLVLNLKKETRCFYSLKQISGSSDPSF
jgi:hypothetical protein